MIVASPLVAARVKIPEFWREEYDQGEHSDEVCADNSDVESSEVDLGLEGLGDGDDDCEEKDVAII